MSELSTISRLIKLADKNGGVGKPEMRIPALFFGSFFVPVGLFWYGWSAQAKLHWIMPIIGSRIFGFGMMTTLYAAFTVLQTPLLTYLRIASQLCSTLSIPSPSQPAPLLLHL